MLGNNKQEFFDYVIILSEKIPAHFFQSSLLAIVLSYLHTQDGHTQKQPFTKFHIDRNLMNTVSSAIANKDKTQMEHVFGLIHERSTIPM